MLSATGFVQQEGTGRCDMALLEWSHQIQTSVSNFADVQSKRDSAFSVWFCFYPYFWWYQSCQGPVLCSLRTQNKSRWVAETSKKQVCTPLCENTWMSSKQAWVWEESCWVAPRLPQGPLGWARGHQARRCPRQWLGPAGPAGHGATTAPRACGNGPGTAAAGTEVELEPPTKNMFKMRVKGGDGKTAALGHGGVQHLHSSYQHFWWKMGDRIIAQYFLKLVHPEIASSIKNF